MRENVLKAGFHSRGYLPHLKAENRSYFVTFRLAGTLPRPVLVQLKREREEIMRNALANKRPLTWREQEELFRWYSAKVDAYLDSGRGDCYLQKPEIADLVAEALKFFENDRYNLHAWVIMPNHVHAVVWPNSGFSLDQILHSWKSFTASKVNRILRRVGQPFWQKESYDHLVRDDEDRSRSCKYVVENPVNAGLCARPEDWKWSSAYRMAAGMPPEPAGRMPALQRTAS